MQQAPPASAPHSIGHLHDESMVSYPDHSDSPHKSELDLGFGYDANNFDVDSDEDSFSLQDTQEDDDDNSSMADDEKEEMSRTLNSLQLTGIDLPDPQPPSTQGAVKHTPRDKGAAAFQHSTEGIVPSQRMVPVPPSAHTHGITTHNQDISKAASLPKTEDSEPDIRSAKTHMYNSIPTDVEHAQRQSARDSRVSNLQPGLDKSVGLPLGESITGTTTLKQPIDLTEGPDDVDQLTHVPDSLDSLIPARKSLFPTVFVNDEALMFVLKTFQTPDVVIIDTHSSKGGIFKPGKLTPLQGCTKIIVPLHHESLVHWTIALVNDQSGKIEHRDSLKCLDAHIASSQNLLDSANKHLPRSSPSPAWTCEVPVCILCEGRARLVNSATGMRPTNQRHRLRSIFYDLWPLLDAEYRHSPRHML